MTVLEQRDGNHGGVATLRPPAAQQAPALGVQHNTMRVCNGPMLKSNPERRCLALPTPNWPNKGQLTPPRPSCCALAASRAGDHLSPHRPSHQPGHGWTAALASCSRHPLQQATAARLAAAHKRSHSSRSSSSMRIRQQWIGRERTNAAPFFSLGARLGNRSRRHWSGQDAGQASIEECSW